MVMVVVAVVVSPVSSIVVVARAVVAVVVDALGASASLDGVPYVPVGPKLALDCRCGGPSPLPVLPMLRGRWVRDVHGRCSCSPSFRALARSRAFRLLCRRLE
jgi:hypothetical protein